ncbi:MAG: hypothetical protein JWO03_1364 [Bacteroidetes bacterium]|nr:hypothetical protein [Bacteroidota bacterium]
MKPTHLLLTLLIGLLMSTSALPALAAREKMKRNVTFIVRKPDKIKNIAARFQVTPKQLTTLNKHVHKGQIVYAGKALVIPVWLQRKSGNQNESSEFNPADYILAGDSLDEYIGEDFINTMDIEADTVRRGAIDREVKVLDKKLYVLYVSYDSVLRVENAEFSDLSLREQKKLLISRMRNNPHASLNASIDSLNAHKARLAAEKARINARVADYENLVENALYAEAHPEGAEDIRTIRLREWGDDPTKAPAGQKGTKSKK